MRLRCVLVLLWYKLIYRKSLTVGARVHFRKRFDLMVASGASCSIGDDVFFNNGCSLNANERIEIGSNCLFGESVKVYDNDHRFNEYRPIAEQGFSCAPVVIGSNTWIGSNVVVLKGTQIGANCVVGAGCVLRGKIPDGTIVRSKDSDLVFEPIRFKDRKDED